MATFSTTAKYALRWLPGTNLVSDVDAGFQALAEDVDAAFAGYAEGTFAGMPAAGKAGRLYRCTDTATVYMDTGSVWIPHGPAPGDIKASAIAAAPTGWLLCDGAAVARTGANAALFAAISTVYGAGNGSTTFNVPDLRGRVPVGVDGAAARLTANDALGQSGGEEKHTLTTGEMPAGVPWTNASTITFWSLNGGTASGRWAPAGDAGVSNWNPGGAGAHNVMQPYVVINWMVKL